MSSSYKVPDLPLFGERGFSPSSGGEECRIRFEEEIKRSRFITTLARADSRERALAFVESVRREFPDARHHCWAYAVGRPGDTAQVGQSDDGEPHGTAGRPMLAQLLASAQGGRKAVGDRQFYAVLNQTDTPELQQQGIQIQQLLRQHGIPCVLTHFEEEERA